MANNNNLKELIFKLKEQETQEKIEPMKEDIYRFIEKLKDYCLRNKELRVRIIYKVKNESATRYASEGYGWAKNIIEFIIK